MPKMILVEEKMRKAIILLSILLAGCGISQQDVDATIAALPSQTSAETATPTLYEVVFEVRSALVQDIFNDELWEISWGINGSLSSFTYTSMDLYRQHFEGQGYRVHWTETKEAYSGDEITLTLEGYPESYEADCAINVNGKDVSVATKGDGAGKAICEYELP